MMKMGLTILSALILTFSFMIVTASDKEEKEDMTQEKTSATVSGQDYATIPFENISGKKMSLRDWQGKVVLIVNVASKCGYTPQYSGLEKLYQTYKDKGLVVVGFPANNFGGQEPGTNDEILNFCRTTYDVTFPMMSKVSVKGGDKHPLFVYFTEKSPFPGEIQWNFAKFLLDKKGNLAARYPSQVKPDDKDLIAEIESLL